MARSRTGCRAYREWCVKIAVGCRAVQQQRIACRICTLMHFGVQNARFETGTRFMGNAVGRSSSHGTDWPQ